MERGDYLESAVNYTIALLESALPTASRPDVRDAYEYALMLVKDIKDGRTFRPSK